MRIRLLLELVTTNLWCRIMMSRCDSINSWEYAPIKISLGEPWQNHQIPSYTGLSSGRRESSHRRSGANPFLPPSNPNRSMVGRLLIAAPEIVRSALNCVDCGWNPLFAILRASENRSLWLISKLYLYVDLMKSAVDPHYRSSISRVPLN